MVGLTKARAANGQFPKGQSGNPGGRPRDEQKVAELARSHSREAIETLAELMRNSNDERVRGTATQTLLDRGWGKPKVEVVLEAGGGCHPPLRRQTEWCIGGAETVISIAPFDKLKKQSIAKDRAVKMQEAA